MAGHRKFDYDKIYSMYKEGMSPSEISARLNIPKDNVKCIIGKMCIYELRSKDGEDPISPDEDQIVVTA